MKGLKRERHGDGLTRLDNRSDEGTPSLKNDNGSEEATLEGVLHNGGQPKDSKVRGLVTGKNHKIKRPRLQ